MSYLQVVCSKFDSSKTFKMLFQKTKVHCDVTLNFGILSTATLISDKQLVNQFSVTAKGTEKSCQILNKAKRFSEISPSS